MEDRRVVTSPQIIFESARCDDYLSLFFFLDVFLNSCLRGTKVFAQEFFQDTQGALNNFVLGGKNF